MLINYTKTILHIFLYTIYYLTIIEFSIILNAQVLRFKLLGQMHSTRHVYAMWVTDVIEFAPILPRS